MQYIVTLCVGALLFAVALMERDKLIRSACETFRMEARAEAARVASRLSSVHAGIYQGARTIARLPGVRNIHRYSHGPDFESTARQAAQELYNNFAQSIDISEIHIASVEMQPDESDAAAGSRQKPIATFDGLTIGQNADLKKGHDAAKTEEIEIYEYRLIREQLDRMLAECPRIEYVKGLAYPLYVSEEVITCDNTYYSPSEPNDADKSGLVFSTPFYGYDGRLKGCVSVVVLRKVFQDLLPNGDYAVIAPAYNFVVPGRPPGQSSHSLAWVERGEPDTTLTYSSTLSLETADERGGWALWAGASEVGLAQSEAMRSAREFFWAAGGAVALLTLAVLFLIHMQDKRRKELDSQNKELQGQLKEQTAELRRKHANLQAVFSAATDTIIISADYFGKVSIFNEGACRILGYSADDVKEDFSILNIFDKELLESTLKRVDCSSQSQMFEALTALTRFGVADRKERTLVRADGSLFPADMTISPIFAVEAEGQEIKGFLFFGIDISEAREREELTLEAGKAATMAHEEALRMAEESEHRRLQLEEAMAQVELAEMELRASQKRSEEVTSTINEALWSMDAETQTFTYLSEACETIFGFLSGDYLSRPDLLENAIHIDDKLLYFENLDRLGRGQRVNFDFRITDAGGASKWIKAVASPIEFDGNKATRFTGSFSDITELREATDALQESEARVRAILENVVDGIITLDASGAIQMSNPAMSSLFGYPPEALLNTHIAELIRADNGETPDVRDSEFMRQTLAQAAADGCSLTATSADGRKFPIEIAFSEFHLTGSKFYIAVIRDITQRLAQQNFLTQAEKNTAISALAAGVAHEFKNCLGGIMGNATLALDYSDEASLVKESLETIVEISDKANRIALSLLSYAQTGDTDDAVSCAQSVIRETKVLLENECRERNVRLRIDIDERLFVAIDPANLQQAIINITLNSIQASDSGGVVLIRGFREKNVAIIEMRDSGRGMDDAEVKLAFDPFYSSKGVWGDDDSAGQGLGLTTARNIIEKSGGSIELRSRKGSGTTVEIHLPLGPDSDKQQDGRQFQDVSQLPVVLLHKFTDSSLIEVGTLLDQLPARWKPLCSKEALESALVAEVGIVILDGMAPSKIEFVQMFEYVRSLRTDVRMVVVVDATYDYYIADYVKSADYILQQPVSLPSLCLALSLAPPVDITSFTA